MYGVEIRESVDTSFGGQHSTQTKSCTTRPMWRPQNIRAKASLKLGVGKSMKETLSHSITFRPTSKFEILAPTDLTPNKKIPCRVVPTRRGFESVHWPPSVQRDAPYTALTGAPFSENAITQKRVFCRILLPHVGVPPGCTREPGRVRRLGTLKSRFPEDLAPLADELIE